MDKFSDIIKKVGSWIMWSSVNQDKVSLTLKGFIPFLVLFHFSNVTSLQAVSDSLTNFVVVLGSIVAGVVALYGAGRKVFVTLQTL